MKKLRNISILFISVLLSFSFISCSGSSTSSGGNPPSEEEEVIMTSSYSDARRDFEYITGITLPKISDIEAKYNSDESKIDIEINKGTNVNYQSYNKIETTLKNALGEFDSGFPKGDMANGRIAEWLDDSTGRWYQITWSFVPINLITIKSELKIDEKVTDSYKNAKEQFDQYCGFILPDIKNVEARKENIDAFDIKEPTYVIDLYSGASINKKTYYTIQESLKRSFSLDTGYPIEEDDLYISKLRGYSYKYQLEYSLKEKYIKITAQMLHYVTDSYRSGVEAFYDITGITLPDYYYLDLEDTSIFDRDKHIAHFHVSIKEDMNIPDNFYTAITKKVKYLPVIKDLDNKHIEWIWEEEFDNHLYKVNLKFYIEGEDILKVDYDITPIRRLLIGSYDINAIKVVTFINDVFATNLRDLLVGDVIDIFAITNNDYIFLNWELNDEVVSSSKHYSYVIKDSDIDITISPNFIKVDNYEGLTESYIECYKQFKELTCFDLPLFLDVEASYSYNQTKNRFTIEISEASIEKYEAYVTYFKELLPLWVFDEGEVDGRFGSLFHCNSNEDIRISFDSSTSLLKIEAEGFTNYYKPGNYMDIKLEFINRFKVLLPDLSNEDIRIYAEFDKNNQSDGHIRFEYQLFTTDDFNSFVNYFIKQLGEPNKEIDGEEDDPYDKEIQWYDDNDKVYILRWNEKFKRIFVSFS